MTSWRDELRGAVATFGAPSSARGGWVHADASELVGLERWGTELATRNLAAGVGALVTVARAAFPDIVRTGGEALAEMGLTGEAADGASCEAMLEIVGRWLDDPQGTRPDVEAGFDRSRQLYAWDDDLRPTDDAAYFWFLEVGQCCGAAIVNTGGDPDASGYYEWPPATCVGRGLVVVARSLRMPGVTNDAVVKTLASALAAV